MAKGVGGGTYRSSRRKRPGRHAKDPNKSKRKKAYRGQGR